MRYSQLFSKTTKSVKEQDSVNATLLQKGGFIHQEMSGVYTFLPLGLRVLTKIEDRIRAAMMTLGASEILMPALHPKENWLTTGRYHTEDAVLFKLTSKHGYSAVLGSTHEEIVTPIALSIINSYKDLPRAVFQIQTKFRDELRAKGGLLRGREFRMKDLYSFHADQDDLDHYYARVAESYTTFFKELGIEAFYTEASGGSFSKFSHEFQVELPSGEDTVYVCEECGMAKNKEIFEEGATCTRCNGSRWRETAASEVGNIFPLKTRFSEPFKLFYTDAAGQKQPVLMACYGIGSSRVMGVLVEKFHDEKGIAWPKNVSPADAHLVGLNLDDASVREKADKAYEALINAGVEVLYDDRAAASPGEKFAEADLIGIPYRLVVSKKTGESVELKARGEESARLLTVAKAVADLCD